MPDDQHLPTPGNRQHARRAADSYSDEQPPDLDGPPEVDAPAQAASVPGGTQLPTVPPTPPAASETLAYILSVVHDPKHRHAIEEFARTWAGTREDHMLTGAAMMATAIMENHIDRAKRLEGGMAALYKGIAEEAATMADAGALLDLDTLRAAFRAEATDLAHDAFKAGFKTALAVGAGGLVVGLLLAFIIHIL